MAIDPPSKNRNGEFWMFANFKWPEDIPQKPLNELTEDQRRRILNLYRFASFTPGNSQCMSGSGFPY